MTEKINNTTFFNETKTQTTELKHIENSLSGLNNFDPRNQQTSVKSSQNNTNNTNKK